MIEAQPTLPGTKKNSNRKPDKRIRPCTEETLRRAREAYAKRMADPVKAAKRRAQIARNKAALMADPERLARVKEKQRQKDQERASRIKADPELLKERNRKRNEWWTKMKADPVKGARQRAKDHDRHAAMMSKPELARKALTERRANYRAAVATPELKKQFDKRRKEYLDEVFADPIKAARWREWHRRRRAMRRCVIVSMSKAIIEWEASVKSKRRARCYWCGKIVSTKTIHVDHIVALAKGGPHEIGNLCVSCAPCNLSKNDKLLEAWNEQLQAPALL